MNDRFQELKVFVRAAESGSFSITARDLGLSQPSVSRIVSELEERLGTRLLLRNTRGITTTDAGVAFLGRARQIMRDLDDADEAARGVDSLGGVLRVAMSSVLGVRAVIPSLPAFLVRHPLLKIELLTSDAMHDLVAEGVDMAVRFGELEDSGFGARRLATVQRCLVASPAYLAAHGTPVSIAELAAHHCIGGPGGSANPRWSFRRDGIADNVKIEPTLKVASAEAVLAAARAGLGITIASTWLCGDDLAAANLVTVLADWHLEPVEVHAVYPVGRLPSQKVVRFTEHLLETLAAFDAGTAPAPA